MKKATMIALILTVALSTFAVAEEVGTVRIPREVVISNIVVPAGTYTVALYQGEAGMMISLVKDDMNVVSDLAATKPADKNYDSARIAYQTLRRDGNDDPLIARVLVNYRGTLYLLYCEKS